MDQGLAALLGALVGGAASISTTWLSEILRTSRENKLTRLRKKRLLQLLEGPKYTWRELGTLKDAIGASEETTVALLLELNCRQSMAKNKKTWALISRAPFPDDKP